MRYFILEYLQPTLQCAFLSTRLAASSPAGIGKFASENVFLTKNSCQAGHTRDELTKVFCGLVVVVVVVDKLFYQPT
jgi:hypothetical protein